jgi:site-specific DNA recombinase
VPIYGEGMNADGTRHRQHVVRQINPAQARIIVKVFEMYASGFGLTGIAKTLNAEQVPPPHGGPLGWCPTALRDILRRELYRGIVYWNRTQTIQRGGTRRQVKRPESQWLRIEAPECRIVSEVLWEQVAARHAVHQQTYLRGANGRLVSRPTGEDQRSVSLLSSLAKCVTCGGSIVAITRKATRGRPRNVYACAYHHKRGKAICTNNTQVRQDILDSAILHAMNDAIDSRVLEASVAQALAQLRAEQTKWPDRRLAIERELALVQTRIHHLVEAIANKGGSEEIFRPLHIEETRKKTLVAELAQLDAMADTISLDEKRIVQTVRARLRDLPALFGRHVPLARQMLRKLLDGHIHCEPILEGGKPGYRFTATGTFDRLLTGVQVVNDGGGGQGS